MNRRTFFRTATLSTVAALHRTAQSSTPMNPPFEVDIADPGAATHIGDPRVDLFARLEAPAPEEPGELSGAALYISEIGEEVLLSAGFRDILQRGDRPTTRHLLGCIEPADVAPVASIDPKAAAGKCVCVPLRDGPGLLDHGRVWLIFTAGENPELRLCLASGRELMSANINGSEAGAGHCLGVLRGELLTSFFDYLHRRRALGETA
jgi:hypothetical protein